MGVCSIQLAFLGQTKERESRFPRVRLLGLIKDDKYDGWENLIALNIIKSYLNRIHDVKTILQRAF